MFVGAIALAFLTALIPSVASNITGAETTLAAFPGTYAMLGLTVLVLVGAFLWSMLRGSGMVNAIALPAAAGPVGYAVTYALHWSTTGYLGAGSAGFAFA